MLRQRVDLTVLDDLDDLLLDRLADSLELLRLAIERHLRDGGAGLADPRRRPPVGEHAERLHVLELEDVGQQLELRGDVGVGGQAGHPARDDTAVRAIVCLPTYNERENLEPMLRALGDVLPPDAGVLVVDDSSPDGTGQLADELAAELPYVDVLHRPRKEGLGRAYLAAFRRALADGAELDSRDGLRLLARPDAPCRSCSPQPRTPTSCSGRATSRAGASRTGARCGASSRPAARVYARVLLGVGVRDLTGGFKCYRRAVLETIDLDAVTSTGYAFQIETTYRALRAGFRVVEIPITFADREAGASKMSKRIFLEAVWKVPLLRARALAGRL